MIATGRRTVIIAALLIFFAGLGFGYLSGANFNFDRHSYMGGVSYILSRGDQLAMSGIDPMIACNLYLDEGMNVEDGYPSSVDFLAGCQDAYERQGFSMSLEIDPRSIAANPIIQMVYRPTNASDVLMVGVSDSAGGASLTEIHPTDPLFPVLLDRLAGFEARVAEVRTQQTQRRTWDEGT